MSQSDELTLLLLKGIISDLPDEKRKLIYQYRDEFKKILDESNLKDKGCAQIAFSLIGAEIAAEDK